MCNDRLLGLGVDQGRGQTAGTAVSGFWSLLLHSSLSWFSGSPILFPSTPQQSRLPLPQHLRLLPQKLPIPTGLAPASFPKVCCLLLQPTPVSSECPLPHSLKGVTQPKEKGKGKWQPWGLKGGHSQIVIPGCSQGKRFERTSAGDGHSRPL